MRVEFEMMIKLAKCGAKLNARNAKCETPLHLAVRAESAEIIKCGKTNIAASADMGEVIRMAKRFPTVFGAWDRHGVTPLHYALSPETIQQLADCGADVNARDCLGRTPLHYAAEKNARETVVALRDIGADAGARNLRGDSPLDIADEFGNEKISELLCGNPAPKPLADK